MARGDQLPGTRGIDMLREARKALSAGVPERDLQRTVVEMAEVLGWSTFHVRDSRGSNPGWPDLALVRGNRLVFVELKSATGRLTAEQLDVLGRLDAVEHVETHVWRPGDIDDAEICLRRAV
jgi:hypothetical protein